MRKETVETVFGIIEEALGFRRFHLRGLCRVGLESVAAYNVKRPITSAPFGTPLRADGEAEGGILTACPDPEP